MLYNEEYKHIIISLISVPCEVTQNTIFKAGQHISIQMEEHNKLFEILY
jgi:hypothetical protein